MYEKQEIVTIIQNFYRKLYKQALSDAGYQRDSREQILNVGSEKISEIDTSELETALKSMKNFKVPSKKIPHYGRNAERRKSNTEKINSHLTQYRQVSRGSPHSRCMQCNNIKRGKKLDFYQSIQ